MKLVGIAGRKGSGKDTFAQPLLIENEGTFNLVKFADPLKNMLRSLFRDAGLDAGTIELMIEGNLKEMPTPILGNKSPRYAMQTLGTEWRNMLTESLWLGITESRLKRLARGGAKGVIITDVRFPHEVAFLKEHGGSVFRIVGREQNNEFSNHASEKLIDELSVDGEIFNFGSITDLHAMAGFVVSSAVGNCNI
jgi:hypothetical protein